MDIDIDINVDIDIDVLHKCTYRQKYRYIDRVLNIGKDLDLVRRYLADFSMRVCISIHIYICMYTYMHTSDT